MSAKSSGNRRSLAATRLLAKLDTAMQAGDYYQAHQLYRTVYFRYAAAGRYAELIDLLYDGGCRLMERGQSGSGADLANLLLDVLLKAQQDVCDQALLDKVRALFARMKPCESLYGRELKRLRGRLPYSAEHMSKREDAATSLLSSSSQSSAPRKTASGGVHGNGPIRGFTNVPSDRSSRPSSGHVPNGDLDPTFTSSTPPLTTNTTTADVRSDGNHASCESVNRGAFIQSAIKWSKAVQPQFQHGHPSLHEQFAHVFWHEKNYIDARYHFLLSHDSEGCASFLIEYQQSYGYPGEVDLFIAQAVLQFLCHRNRHVAASAFDHYTAKHPSIPTGGPPFPTFPLLNFLWMLLCVIGELNGSTVGEHLAFGSGKTSHRPSSVSVPTRSTRIPSPPGSPGIVSPLAQFTVLVERYRPSIQRDPCYSGYLDLIGQLWFDLPPPPSMTPGGGGGLFSQIFRGFMDVASGGSEGTNITSSSSGRSGISGTYSSTATGTSGTSSTGFSAAQVFSSPVQMPRSDAIGGSASFAGLANNLFQAMGGGQRAPRPSQPTTTPGVSNTAESAARSADASIMDLDDDLD
jgi:hypothetical protein